MFAVIKTGGKQYKVAKDDVIVVEKLTGEAGGIQVPDARIGGIFNMGGAAVANYVSILERIK
jgi:acetyl-CoA C-acetyltransferase